MAKSKEIEPLFTVTIPTYNREEYLAESIDSILNQTCNDFEIVIVDDGSTDGTKELMKYYVDGERIRYYRRKHEGIAKSRNFAISVARGKYIICQDSDDWSYPERLKAIKKKIDKKPEVDIIYTSFQVCDKDLKPVHVIEAREFSFKKLLEEQYIGQPSLCYKRSMALELPYNDKLKYGEDWEFLVKAASVKKKFQRIPQILVKYRTHPDSISIRKKKEVDKYDREMIKKYK